MANYLEVYKQTHTHPMNRLTHTFGIPMIVISLIVVFFNWRWGVGLFVGGWILQFIGHIFEGKLPAFFSNPIYLIVGPYWWVRKTLGLVPKETRDSKS
jgi:uncharacterized membrane protein YGL010W